MKDFLTKISVWIAGKISAKSYRECRSEVIVMLDNIKLYKKNPVLYRELIVDLTEMMYIGNSRKTVMKYLSKKSK